MELRVKRQITNIYTSYALNRYQDYVYIISFNPHNKPLKVAPVATHIVEMRKLTQMFM